MTTLSASRPAPRLPLLVLLVAATYAVELLVVRSAAFARAPDAIAAAVAFDLAVVVPLAWWWLVVRAGAARARTLLPVVALSLLGARLVLPAEHRAFVGLARWLVAPLEIALVIAAVRGVRAAMRRAARPADLSAPDVVEALDATLRGILGAPMLAGLVATELATLYYALRPRRGATIASGHALRVGGGFAPAIAWGLALATGVESVGLHLWLAPSHPALAWTLTALGGYTLLWLAGQQRASAHRESGVVDGTLVLRVGLRLTARIPLGDVAEVHRLDWRTRPARAAEYLDAARPGEPNVLLTLRAPTTVTAALGLRRTVTRIGLCVDAPEVLVAEMGTARG